MSVAANTRLRAWSSHAVGRRVGQRYARSDVPERRDRELAEQSLAHGVGGRVEVCCPRADVLERRREADRGWDPGTLRVVPSRRDLATPRWRKSRVPCDLSMPRR